MEKRAPFRPSARRDGVVIGASCILMGSLSILNGRPKPPPTGTVHLSPFASQLAGMIGLDVRYQRP